MRAARSNRTRKFEGTIDDLKHNSHRSAPVVGQRRSRGALHLYILRREQATLGFQDAIDEVNQQKENGTIPEDEGNVLKAADDVAEGGDAVLYVLAALAAIFAVLLVAGALWALRRKRSYEKESDRRDREIARIAQMLASEGLGPAPNSPSSETDDEQLTDEEVLRQAMRHVAERTGTTGDSAPKR